MVSHVASGTPDGLGGFHPALLLALLEPPQPARRSAAHTAIELITNFTLTDMEFPRVLDFPTSPMNPEARHTVTDVGAGHSWLGTRSRRMYRPAALTDRCARAAGELWNCRDPSLRSREAPSDSRDSLSQQLRRPSPTGLGLLNCGGVAHCVRSTSTPHSEGESASALPFSLSSWRCRESNPGPCRPLPYFYVCSRAIASRPQCFVRHCIERPSYCLAFRPLP